MVCRCVRSKTIEAKEEVSSRSSWLWLSFFHFDQAEWLLDNFLSFECWRWWRRHRPGIRHAAGCFLIDLYDLINLFLLCVCLSECSSSCSLIFPLRTQPLLLHSISDRSQRYFFLSTSFSPLYSRIPHPDLV